MELRDLAALVDQYVAHRDERLALQRRADEIKELEVGAKAALLEALKTQEVGGVAGKLYRATLKTKQVPQVADWTALYAYITEHDAFELLQKRLSPPAVVERWEAGEAVAGVVQVQVDDLSINKL